MTPSIRSDRPVLRAWRRIPGPPRDPVKARLLRLYVALERRFGRQRGRSARSPLEAAVGAILAENAAGTAALRARGWLTPGSLAAAPPAELAVTLRVAASGSKARRLRSFARWLLENSGASFTRMRRDPLVALRREIRRA